jgi:hypothetical protein
MISLIFPEPYKSSVTGFMGLQPLKQLLFGNLFYEDYRLRNASIDKERIAIE